MYSDTEIEGAVNAGVIDRAAADRLRNAIAQQRDSRPVDEEQFRLVTSFNDIFVTIAAALLLFACGTLFGHLGGLVVAGVSWGLAEYFTRRKRMALPSIFLLVTYAAGIFGFLMTMTFTAIEPNHASHAWAQSYALLVGTAASGCLTAAAVAAHWTRFHVPITVAAGAASLAVVAGSLLTMLLMVAGAGPATVMGIIPWFAFAIGVAMFAFAMRWDLSDPERITRRSDVAFWLHLTASPLIVHPLFLDIARLGSHGAASQIGAALIALILYAMLGILALIVDRRAVLVSGLAYVIIAIGVLMHQTGQVGTGLAASGAVIGSLLLAMSVFWRDLRRTLLAGLPERFRIRLPDAGARTGGSMRGEA